MKMQTCISYQMPNPVLKVGETLDVSLLAGLKYLKLSDESLHS